MSEITKEYFDLKVEGIEKTINTHLEYQKQTNDRLEKMHQSHFRDIDDIKIQVVTLAERSKTSSKIWGSLMGTITGFLTGVFSNK